MKKSSTWNAQDLPSFADRTVVITGANSGLGLLAAGQFARVGARVILAVRDVVRGHEVAAAIAGRTEVRALDLASLASVRRFAERWEGDDIDVLINNAGIMMVPEGRTADGFELQLGVNHLGHFALTNLLLPFVRDRVVTVSSQAHRRGVIDLNDLNWVERPYGRAGAYGQSKLANLLFTLELQRRLTDVRLAVAAHPGWAATNLQSHTGNHVMGALMKVGNALIAQPASSGVLPILYAASQELSPADYIGPDGMHEYRGAPTVVGRSDQASDAELAKQLWEASELLTGVTFPGARA